MVQIVEVNAAAVRWYGHKDKQSLKVRLSKLMHPNEYSRLLDEILIFEKGLDHYEVSVEGKARNGNPLYLIINGSLAPGYEQTWGRVIVSILDITESKSAENNLKEAYDTTLEGWAKALELRDKETEGHSRRVIDATLLIARKMGIPESDLIDMRRGAVLHDIGKMAIPDEVLKKPGPLTAEEREIIQKHPQAAYDLLSKIPFLKKALDIPFCHHEKWDGSGYPRGLRGTEIPLHARIFAVVDVWDALTNDRPYRRAWSKDTAVQYLNEQAGLHFDPAIVQLFLNLIEQGEI